VLGSSAERALAELATTKDLANRSAIRSHNAFHTCLAVLQRRPDSRLLSPTLLWRRGRIADAIAIVSHSHVEDAFALWLVADLQAAGVNAWRD
jgi:hypothetical protein